MSEAAEVKVKTGPPLCNCYVAFSSGCITVWFLQQSLLSQCPTLTSLFSYGLLQSMVDQSPITLLFQVISFTIIFLSEQSIVLVDVKLMHKESLKWTQSSFNLLEWTCRRRPLNCYFSLTDQSALCSSSGLPDRYISLMWLPRLPSGCDALPWGNWGLLLRSTTTSPETNDLESRHQQSWRSWPRL